MRYKFTCFFLSAAIILASGCATTKTWNSYIDDKLLPRPKSDSFQKGFYLGTIQENEIRYHRYLFPNAFENANTDYIEILLPLDRSNKVPIVRRALPQNIPQNTNYNSLIEYNDLRPINSKSSQIIEIFDQSITEFPYPLSYPFFVKMTIVRLGERPRIRYGQMVRKPKDYSYVNDPLMNKTYFLACPEDKYLSFYLPSSTSPAAVSDNTKCDLWYWSDDLVGTDTYDDFSKEVGYSTLKYAGYLVTVPIDIILAPVRGLAAVAGIIAISNWSGH